MLSTNNMDKPGYYNIAFISYKREDEKWAKWLQRKLEYYKLPSKIKKQNPNLEFASDPRHVFKDTTDLSSGVLEEAIQKGLNSSKFLIVICSPRAARSKWVCKEIQTFIHSGRGKNIIPFIIEGEPLNPENECFPEALRSLSEENELLGISINENGRDAAVVKIVAHMFDLRFDVLWQRFRRYKRIRNGILIFCISMIAVLSLLFSLTILSKNNVIESQNEQLSNLVLNLKETNKTYSQLPSDAKQYTYTGQLRGNNCSDLDLLHVAFHPYEPIVAFSDDWGYWLHYLNSNVEKSLPIKEDSYAVMSVSDLYFSTDGKELMATSFAGTYLWNIEDCELIGYYFPQINQQQLQKFIDKTYSDKQDKESIIQYINDKRHLQLSKKIFYNFKNKTLNIIDKITNRKICSTDFDKDSNLFEIYNPIYDEILFITDNKAALYDNTKKDFVLFFKGYHNSSGFEFSENGEYLRVENNIYKRNIKVDTIRNLTYRIYPMEKYPLFPKEKKYQYDSINNASLKIEENNIIYKSGKFVKKIEVLRPYTLGNAQEVLQAALFAGPNKIVAIVAQGKHRIYSTKTWNLIGTLDNYIWDGNPSMGHENNLDHASSYIATVKYVYDRLYILSSGGIIRIYNVNKCRLETIIELPINENITGGLERFYLTDDASCIYYSFDNNSYYVCDLPQIN